MIDGWFYLVRIKRTTNQVRAQVALLDSTPQGLRDVRLRCASFFQARNRKRPARGIKDLVQMLNEDQKVHSKYIRIKGRRVRLPCSRRSGHALMSLNGFRSRRSWRPSLR